jgi:CRISPR-associated protein Cas2
MSRLTIELKAGVFVGNINRRIREKLWDKIVHKWKANALLIYTTNNEQGFGALANGDTSRELIDHEGLLLTQFTRTDKAATTEEISLQPQRTVSKRTKYTVPDAQQA